jgi:hypothetical protein
MPMPSPRVSMTEDWQEMMFRERASWQLQFVFLPKRSALTRRWLWLKFVYQGIVKYTGPGEPILYVRYHENAEHLIWMLKGK